MHGEITGDSNARTGQSATGGNRKQELLDCRGCFDCLGRIEIPRGCSRSRCREREWQEEALFYQRRQWLEWKEGERRFIQIKPDKRKPRPMPVSNYFAKAINANANQLGSELVRVIATAKHDDPHTRRAADYAEMAKDAIDVESNMRLLNPLLAKHTALWGIGVTKETLDTTEEQAPLDEQEMESQAVVGCLDCGQVTPQGSAEGTDEDNFSQQQVPCPSCASDNTATWTQNNATTVSQYVTGKGKIKTEVRPIFEIYLPRDVQNPNISPRIIQRYRRPLSACRRVWGDKASDLKSDDPATNTSETRFDVLRTLTAYSYAEKINAETVMLTEVWAKWDQLPKKLQEILEAEFEGEDEEDESEENASAMDLQARSLLFGNLGWLCSTTVGKSRPGHQCRSWR